jgi:hypothetical protein
MGPVEIVAVLALLLSVITFWWAVSRTDRGFRCVGRECVFEDPRTGMSLVLVGTEKPALAFGSKTNSVRLGSTADAGILVQSGDAESRIQLDAVEQGGFPPTLRQAMALGAEVINMDRNPERLAKMMQWSRKLGIPMRRFPAVVGTKSVGNLSKSQYGCAMSHITLWKRIVDQQLPYLWIMEDDCLFSDRFVQLGETLYQTSLARNPDIIFPGSINLFKNPPESVSAHKVWALHCYLISLKGARKLLRHIEAAGLYNSIDGIVYDLIGNRPDSLISASWIVGPTDEERKRWDLYLDRASGLVFQNAEFVSDIPESHVGPVSRKGTL